MNGFDFLSFPGERMPGSKHNMDWMQQSVKDVLKWMGYDPDTDSYPDMILSGCVWDDLTNGASPGWMLIGGEILPYIGGVGRGWELQEDREDVIFEGGIPLPAKLTRYLKPVPVSSNQFVFMPRLGDLLGKDALVHRLWENIADTSGDVSYNYWWRLNMLSRTLHVRGTVTVSNADNAGKDPSLYVTPLGVIPVSLANKVPFIMLERYHSKNVANQVGFLNAEILTTGAIAVGVKKAPTGVSSYTVEFNQIFPLD